MSTASIFGSWGAKVNRYSIGSFIIALSIGYWLGFGDGHDKGAYDSTPVERIAYIPSPYDDACATMLEAAWAIEDAPSATLPHKP